MKFRKFTALFTAAALVLGMTACGGTGAETTSADTGATTAADTAEVADTTASEENRTLSATSDNVKLLGRAYYDGSKTICAFSGTGIEFTLTGTKAEITVQGDSAAKADNLDNNARIAIYVDGERTIDEMLAEQEHTFTAFESAEEKTVTIRLVKLSETAMSTFSITGINVEGTIAPTANKEHLIEFVGDSITCGYGVDDENRDHHFSTTTEDCTRAYAIKTANALDADYSLVSISGYGIISGYTSDPDKKVESQQLPKYYDKIGFSYSNDVVENTDWTFERQPDVVVINLGTNDESYCKTDETKMAEYSAAYIEFMKHIREKNPDAMILCVLGTMGNGLSRTVINSVKAYTEETGDTNVASKSLAPQSQSDGYAADWHPTEATHQKVCDKLVEEINKIMNW